MKKLPRDFPIADWESMNTKAQLKAIQRRGLSDKEQWALLNATAPLSVLNQHNQAQDAIDTRAGATRTAIDAINYSAEKGYTTFGDLGITRNNRLTYVDNTDRSSIRDFLKMIRNSILKSLHNCQNECRQGGKKENIEDYSEADLIKLLALYNGRGDAAQEYGKECYGWYQEFSWYN